MSSVNWRSRQHALPSRRPAQGSGPGSGSGGLALRVRVGPLGPGPVRVAAWVRLAESTLNSGNCELNGACSVSGRDPSTPSFGLGIALGPAVEAAALAALACRCFSSASAASSVTCSDPLRPVATILSLVRVRVAVRRRTAVVVVAAWIGLGRRRQCGLRRRLAASGTPPPLYCLAHRRPPRTPSSPLGQLPASASAAVTLSLAGGVGSSSPSAPLLGTCAGLRHQALHGGASSTHRTFSGLRSV